MDIDDLSKSQLLLLTLLVNFVMSIATGIVTVSLLDEAPQTVTQTVNRIVENTVQTVAPSTIPTQVPTQTQQPSEEDQLVSAIKGDQSRTVYLYAGDATSTPIAQGVYLPISRAVVVIADPALPQNASVGFPNGTSVPVSLSKSDASIMIYGFGDGATLPAASATTLVDSATLEQGQAVIGITDAGNAVTGIISKVEGNTVTTTLAQTPKGAAAVNLSGGLVGISTGDGSSYISANEINALLAASSSSGT